MEKIRVYKNRYLKITYSCSEMRDLIREHVYYKDGKPYRKLDDSRPKVPNPDGRMVMSVCGVPLFEHHVVWLLFNDDLPGHLEIDHFDQNPLNNRIDNLRLATGSQNIANQGKRRIKATSRYKGVSWFKLMSRWTARLMYKGKLVYCGYFHDEKEAARAYNAATLQYHGEFAKLNIIED